MAKKRAVDAVVIQDVTHAGATLGELAGLRRQIGQLEAELNDAIDRAKAERDAAAAPLRARVAALEGGLRAFAEYHKPDLFKDRRSVELTYGSMGWRASTALKPQPKKTWGQVLGRLEQLDFEEAIRVKKDVDREVLGRWPSEQLALIGVRRVEKDEFWYEIDEAKLDGR